MQLGERIRKARHERGMNGAELAAGLGLERTAVAQYEAGRSLPSVTVLKKMARLLGVSLDRLCFEEYDARDEIQDKELAAKLATADKLDHRYRALAIEFIEGLEARAKLDEQQRKGRRAA